MAKKHTIFALIVSLALLFHPSPVTALDPCGVPDIPIPQPSLDTNVLIGFIAIVADYIDTLDPPYTIRVVMAVTQSWWEAIVAYTPNSQGLMLLGSLRRPAAEGTIHNKNVALAFATYRVAIYLLPEMEGELTGFMVGALQLDVADTHTNFGADALQNAIAVGNRAAAATIDYLNNDGFNQRGTDGQQYHGFKYDDYTDYEPVNTHKQLCDPDRFQPNTFTSNDRKNVLGVQKHITPHARFTKPFGFQSPNEFILPARSAAYAKPGPKRDEYIAQAQQVVDYVANLTEQDKMEAEHFNSKIRSLGYSLLFIAGTKNFSLEQFIEYDFVTSKALWDGVIVAWSKKISIDSVRPKTAVHFLFGNQNIQGWGGPNKGTVWMRGSEWNSYLYTMPHSEYPSGSTCFCAAYAQVSRRYLGEETYGYSTTYQPGCSRIEPGKPVNPVTITTATWTEFVNRCARSRVISGTHFWGAIESAKTVCTPIGDLVYEEFLQYKNGLKTEPFDPLDRDTFVPGHTTVNIPSKTCKKKD